MKNKFFPLLFIMLLLSVSYGTAQRLSGIRVTSELPVEIYLDGVQVSDQVQSAMICNLKRGNYLIEAYSFSRRGGRELRELVYKDRIAFPGNRVHHIVLDNARPTHPLAYIEPVNEREFRQIMRMLEDASFTKDKFSIIDTFRGKKFFLARQVAEMATAFDYDKDRLTVLKVLYPSVVDPENGYRLLEVLTFSSSKEELSGFMRTVVFE